MRYGKIILITILMMVLSGCTVTYNIEFKNGYAEESMTALDENSNYEAGELNYMISSAQDETSPFVYYEINKVEDGTLSGASLYYKYPIVLFANDSSIINTCYDDVSVEVTDDSIYIKTSNEFKCWSRFDGTLKVNIKSDYNVLRNNADSYDQTTYTWYIEKNDTDDTIEIELEKAIKTTNINNAISISGVYVAAMLGVAVIGAGITIYFVQSKNKKNNEI
jgi:hypothetical protein